MTNSKLNKNWEATIEGFANIINNDFLIKDILSSTKVLNSINEKLYILSNNDFIKNYLNDNSHEITKLYNSINNDNISILVLNDQEWHNIQDKILTIAQNNKNNYLDKSINFNNYVVGEFNKNAYTIVKEIIEKGQTDFNPIFIYSSTGLGKTHLTSALANTYKEKFPNRSICYIDATNFTKEIYHALQNSSQKIEELKELYSSYDLLIIDDVQFLADKTKTNEILFHIFNNLIKNKKILIMTADKNPDSLLGFEERMISRFSSGITIKIKNPDEDSIKNIIRETIKSTNLMMDDDSIRFIYNWFNNDIRILIGAINKIIFFSKLNPNNIINEKTIKDILEIESQTNNIKTNTSNNSDKYVNPGVIITNVAKLYNVSVQDITGTSRKKEIVNARHLIMYILKQIFNMSYKEIGLLLGGRDHTTVMNGVEKTKELITKDKNLLDVINNIVNKI